MLRRLLDLAADRLVLRHLLEDLVALARELHRARSARRSSGRSPAACPTASARCPSCSGTCRRSRSGRSGSALLEEVVVGRSRPAARPPDRRADDGRLRRAGDHDRLVRHGQHLPALRHLAAVPSSMPALPFVSRLQRRGRACRAHADASSSSSSCSCRCRSSSSIFFDLKRHILARRARLRARLHAREQLIEAARRDRVPRRDDRRRHERRLEVVELELRRRADDLRRLAMLCTPASWIDDLVLALLRDRPAPTRRACRRGSA